MGNSASNHAAGNVYIQTDQAFYIAGDTVTGKVHLNILTNYPGNTIYLKIKGYEKSQWQEKHQRTNQQQGNNGQTTQSTQIYYETHHGKNVFYNHQFPLYVWQSYSYMPPGQYTFPFQFKLLDTLPGTYSEAGKHNGCDYQAIIKYKVKAEVISNSSKKIKSRQEMVVREPLKTVVQAQFGEKHVKPSTWCCISKGESHIKCAFERNSYLPGETARVFAEIDNSQCDLEIKRLNCNFIKTLSLHSNNGRELRIARTVQSREFAGVGARQRAIQQDHRVVEVSLQSNADTIIQPSTRGRLVHCEYTLNVSAKHEGCICCSSVPEVTVPVSLVSPPPMNYGVVTAPPNWSPQVFEVRNFAFSNDAMYAKSLPGQNIGVNMGMPAPAMNSNMNMGMPAPIMNSQNNNMYPQAPQNQQPQINMNNGQNLNQMNIGQQQQQQYNNNQYNEQQPMMGQQQNAGFNNNQQNINVNFGGQAQNNNAPHNPFG